MGTKNLRFNKDKHFSSWFIRGFFFIVFVLSSLLLYMPSSYAQTILVSKGKKVLISNESHFLEANKIYYVVTDSVKKVGKVRIDSFKGQNAIGTITAGKAPKGLSILTSGATDSSSGSSSRSSRRSSSTFRVGALAGMVQSTMVVKTATTNVNLKGSDMAFKGFLDIPFGESFDARLALIFYSVNAKGSGTCDLQACYAKFSYVGGDATIKWAFLKSDFRMWLGFNGSVISAGSKSSTAIDTSAVSITGYYGPALGADIKISPSLSIPIQLEYSMFPASGEVTASQIAFFTGLGFLY
ncbi:MAG: hypothetical protein AB7O96_13090 [Pseudobdellovibrionaceae bacterium]